MRLNSLALSNRIGFPKCTSGNLDRDALTRSTLPSRGKMVATMVTGPFDILICNCGLRLEERIKLCI